MKKTILFYYIIFGLLVACKPKLDEFKPSAGEANFSTYVALGNSLTAGYASGALYREGQLNSYPNLLAQQFQLAGGGAFKQPLMLDDNGIGFTETFQPIPKRVLKYKQSCLGDISLSPDTSGTVDLNNLAWIGNQGPFNNMGVPGAKSFHLLAPQLGGTGGNPYYQRFASNPGTSSVISDAVAQNPTFFTLWIGNNDVLLYAASGGEKGGESITPAGNFNGYLGAILNTLKTTGAKGAIANIPNVTDIPYFTTVPYNGLELTDQTKVTALNSAYSQLGITFTLGANPFIIEDSLAPGYLRQIKSSEYLLLTVPQDSLKCKGWGSLKPIPAKYVLDEQEVTAVQSAIAQYNVSISDYANSFNLALVDANTLMKNLKSGLTFEGTTLTTTFVSGGAFSLDGIHLTPIGNAVVANEFIKAINMKYSAQVPLLNVSSYHGIEFP